MMTPGGRQNVTIINESGVYALVFGSKLPKAKEFKHWVTSEVLPSIHKHGMYALDSLLDNPDFMIETFKALKKEREKSRELAATVAKEKEKSQQLAITVTKQQSDIERMQPKETYYDMVLRCKNAVSVTTIAKDYGKAAVWLNEYLHQKGVQYKQGKTWFLYQEHADKGYTKSETFLISEGEKCAVHTKWTQKGRLFIYNLLKADGILPNMEK